MTSALPEGRRGQALAVSLVVLAAFLLWLGVLGPLAGWYADRSETLDQLRARAAREAALIETLPALRAEADSVAKTPTRAVLAGGSDAIAGATLQEQVQAMASSAAAQLTSIETLPAEQSGAYRRIGVRMELSAQLPVVVALLKAIEEAEPSMLVDDIRLTATPDRFAKRATAAGCRLHRLCVPHRHRQGRPAVTAGLSRALWTALVLLAGLVAYEWTGADAPVRVPAPRPHAAFQPQEAEARETAVWSASILQRAAFQLQPQAAEGRQAGRHARHGRPASPRRHHDHAAGPQGHLRLHGFRQAAGSGGGRQRERHRHPRHPAGTG